jgi:hypothetical protein
MVKQAGHILWSLLLLLGLMTELTLSVVHEVASQSQASLRFSQQVQDSSIANAILAQLERLPIPQLSSTDEVLWHPKQVGTKTACGERVHQASWLGSQCPQTQPAWQWWLSVEPSAENKVTDSDSALFKHHVEQLWWLRINVKTSAGATMIIQQQYRQTVLP